MDAYTMKSILIYGFFALIFVILPLIMIVHCAARDDMSSGARARWIFFMLVVNPLVYVYGYGNMRGRYMKIICILCFFSSIACLGVIGKKVLDKNESRSIIDLILNEPDHFYRKKTSALQGYSGNRTVTDKGDYLLVTYEDGRTERITKRT